MIRTMRNKIILAALVLTIPQLASAQSLLDLIGAVGGATSTMPDSQVFCAHIGDFGQNVRTDAAMKATEYRADMDRLALMRDEEKRKVADERLEQRIKEDAARDSLLALLRVEATSSEKLAVIDDFSSTTSKLLHNLRAQSDKAREEYAKVTRNDSLLERASRNRALDNYIDALDAVNTKAQEDCIKRIKDADVLAKYNLMLKDVKAKLSRDLKMKKTSLEVRAKDAHVAELARLDRDYRAAMQKEIAKLIAVFPDFFNNLIATTTPQVPVATSTATSSPQ